MTDNADASEYLSMTWLRAIAVCSFVIGFAPAVVIAQPTPPPQPPQQQPATGLDALTDDKLIADLANRGLTNLLNRAYDVNNVPPAQRGAMQPVLLVKRLADPK